MSDETETARVIPREVKLAGLLNRVENWKHDYRARKRDPQSEDTLEYCLITELLAFIPPPLIPIQSLAEGADLRALLFTNHELLEKLNTLTAAHDTLKADNGPRDRWVCGTCGFILVKSILRASDGAVGMDTREVHDICPNDGTSMRRLTWKEEASGASRMAVEQMERALQAEAKLAALTADYETLKHGGLSLSIQKDPLAISALLAAKQDEVDFGYRALLAIFRAMHKHCGDDAYRVETGAYGDYVDEQFTALNASLHALRESLQREITFLDSQASVSLSAAGYHDRGSKPWLDNMDDVAVRQAIATRLAALLVDQGPA